MCATHPRASPTTGNHWGEERIVLSPWHGACVVPLLCSTIVLPSCSALAGHSMPCRACMKRTQHNPIVLVTSWALL